MLLHLKIRDFAIIDAVEIDFSTGFTVVTGETGAGKSILVDALTLALGGRASADIVRAGAEAAEVEALFDISGHPLVRARLEQRDLVGDDPDTLLVRRVVGVKGRAKVLVNGRLATVAMLAEIVRGLVDISGQHEQQSLLVVDNHIDILDAFGQLDELLGRYRVAYDEWRGLARERDELRQNEDKNLQRADFLRFQLDEIARLSPRPGEDEELELERQRLAHAEKLKGGAACAEALLYGDDGSAFDKLGRAAAEVEALARIDPELVSLAEALTSAQRELKEGARVLQRYSERVEADPTRLAEVDERLAELKRLCRKHGGSLAEVVTRRAELEKELSGLDNADARLAELEGAIAAKRGEVQGLASELSAARKAAAGRFGKQVRAELADMDLAGAVFEVGLEPRRDASGEALGPLGADEVELLWGPNKGEPPRPLARIASGGELSRLMLAVKRVLCSRDLVSLYVFDEVDTGLGGRVADSIGRKIQDVAREHQAITITHLAPIAARADHHLRVRKTVQGERTVSLLEALDGAERAEEIARMIDGASITKATRQAAKEMLARARA